MMESKQGEIARSWSFGISPYAAPADENAERARIGDLARLKPSPITDDMQRATIASWIEWKSRADKETPCERCQICGYGTDYKRPPAEWREDRTQAHSSATTGYFLPCEVCATGYHYAYLTKFSRDWLVDVMLNHFGGDISRVPTLDELKGLL